MEGWVYHPTYMGEHMSECAKGRGHGERGTAANTLLHPAQLGRQLI